MKKTPRSPSPSRSLPMPLWLQAMIEILLTSLGSWFVILVLVLIGWASLGFPGSPVAVLAGTGQLWLAGHGVGLHIDIPMSESTEAVEGLATFTPLGLTVVLLLFARRAGKRLARASYEGQFWQALVGGAVMYIVIGAALSLVTSTSALSSNPVVSAIVPLGVLMVGMFWGGHQVAGSWLRLVGIDPEKLSERYSQYSRWTGAYVVSLIRAAWVGIVGILATGALLTGLSIFFHWNRMISLYQGLHAGFLGDISVTLVQFALLPNLMIFGMAWGNGAGFAVGQGTVISPAATHAGALPSLPILGAVPAEPTTWAYVVLALPILAGAMAGWYFIRDGENHLDEWLTLKLAWRWLAAVLSGLILAISLGALVGLAACLFAALAHGSLGVGRFTDFGPHPWTTGLWTAVTIAIGAIIGQLIGPWIEHDPTTDVSHEPRPARGVKGRGKEPSKPKIPAQNSPDRKSRVRTMASRPDSEPVSPQNGNSPERPAQPKNSGVRASSAKVSQAPDPGPEAASSAAPEPEAESKERDSDQVSALARLRKFRPGPDQAQSSSTDDKAPLEPPEASAAPHEESDLPWAGPDATPEEPSTEEQERGPRTKAPEPEESEPSVPEKPHTVPENRPVIARPGRRRK
ncbi:DUF6350 family protein [Kocuria sp. TGY1127_2]|uniref:cell division protein PerM n=1 Tax=Kocuria sp. TGY1127_2 TaxID=2711328 RepID=UPI0015B8C6DF|nr:DUF6350 family protein [Kocuria sp. TGY1127_2]